jgi:transposase
MSHFVKIEGTFATYLGIDLHTTSLTLAALPGKGEKMTRRTIPTHCTGRLAGFVESLPRPLCVGIESMGSYYWLWDFLEARVDHRILIDPLDFSKLSPREAATDRSVAAKIAYRLRDETVPFAYVPTPRVRSLRRLGRQWHRLTQIAAGAKRQLRWLLHQGNHKGPGTLNGASMQRWLTGQGHKLEAEQVFLMTPWHGLMSQIERDRLAIRRAMLALVAEDERLQHELQLLKSTPGIDDVLGLIILAEFGDFHRFDKADAPACWTGLTERSHVSNRQTYPGKISKAGSATLRWALCEAAHGLICSDVKYLGSYTRIAVRTGQKAIARVAMARRLSRYLWKMIVSDTPFARGPSRPRTARANEVRLRRHRRRQQRHEAKGTSAMN